MHEEAFRSGRHDALREVMLPPDPAIFRSGASHLLDSSTKNLVHRCLEKAYFKTPRFSSGRG